MNELFKIPKSLSGREQWAEDNGVLLTLSSDKTKWVAQRGDDDAEDELRTGAIDKLALVLRRSGVSHWNEEGGR